MRIYFNLRRDSCWDEVHPGKSKAKRKLFQVEFSGGSGEGPGVPSPLFLDQTERPPSPPPSLLSEGLHPPLEWYFQILRAGY